MSDMTMIEGQWLEGNYPEAQHENEPRRATPIQWKGKWENDEPDDWETWTLMVYGEEAGDTRPATWKDLQDAIITNGFHSKDLSSRVARALADRYLARPAWTFRSLAEAALVEVIPDDH